MPFDLASAGISAGAGLLGSIGSMFSSGKAIKAQQEENEKNRQFNAEQAQLSRDYQTDMYNRNNIYNDPKNVVDRLVKAGLNPALAFGGFANGVAPSGGAAASSSGSVSPAMPDYSGLSSAGNSVMQARMQEAQINLMESEAEKNRKDTSWVDRLNTGNLAKLYSSMGVDVSNIKLNSQQAENLVKQGEQIDANIAFVRQQGVTEQLKQKLFDKQVNWTDRLNRQLVEESSARIKQLYSAAHLNDEQALRIGALLAYDIAESQSRTAANYSSADASDSASAVSNQQARSIRFTNDLNETKRRMYGLEGLSHQQWETIEQTNRKIANEADYAAVKSYIEGAEAGSKVLDAIGDLIKPKIEVQQNESQQNTSSNNRASR